MFNVRALARLAATAADGLAAAAVEEQHGVALVRRPASIGRCQGAERGSVGAAA